MAETNRHVAGTSPDPASKRTNRPVYTGPNADQVNNWAPRNNSPRFDEGIVSQFAEKTQGSFATIVKNLGLRLSGSK